MTDSHHPAIAFLDAPRADRVIRLRVSRNTLVALAASILLHALFFFASWPHWQQEPLVPPTTIKVTLAPPQIVLPPSEPPPDLPPPLEPPAPPPKRKSPPKIPTPTPPQKIKVPEVLSRTEPSPRPMPAPTKPELPVQPDKPQDAPVDMMALVKQNRDKREQAEREAARINAEHAAKENGPSEDEKRQQRIMENLKIGTSGIFEVIRIDYRSASFSFKGWQGDYTTARLQYFEVEAGGGQDIRRIMVRRMIGLIREHYDGDFEWISHRLGKSVTKSAKIEDHAELEHFLMQEFFGTHYLAY